MKANKQIMGGLLMAVVCPALCLYGCKTHQVKESEAADVVLTQDVGAITEVDTTAWYLHYYSCVFKVATPKQAKAIHELYGLPAKVGSEIDLSNLTQYFNHVKKDGYGPCERGKQITCSDILEPVLVYE